jgi:glucose-1-phosphate adenylyltransferase
MTRIRTLVVVLAGGAGRRLELLTRERAKPAVPFAGTHRLIDFPLSNCHNAGLADVWIAQQFNPISLSDHLANGRPWDLDRTTGGLLILQPRLGHDERGGFQMGTADSLWRNAPMIREFEPQALVVLSADAVYALDYGELVEDHVRSGAQVTMVTTEVDDAARYGAVELDGERVVDYVYKPDEPKTNTISNEVFVFTPASLWERLETLDEREDLGDELLPQFVADGEARAWRFDRYWRDVGTVDAYHAAHMDLLADDPPLDLDDPDWPILTKAPTTRASAKVSRGAEIADSLIGPGATVAGSV